MSTKAHLYQIRFILLTFSVSTIYGTDPPIQLILFKSINMLFIRTLLTLNPLIKLISFDMDRLELGD